MALLQADAIVVQSCRSLLVLLGHRPQSLRGFAMCEIAGDAATAISVVEQGALLNVHLVTTRRRANGPCARTEQCDGLAGKK
ncbi:hypothetical protein [Bradyrhizobium liaoningense]|uniref:hypothetical protein n=1 Tax=Bradyrhizobium liaoningense TaxID=43992 RepID=UPI001BA706FA|nr:hypothetical protein [Bradyrhizobium liaoningense]MBR0860290.1 hypothetical protein [Bradyrhizobium liaoningense]